MDLVQHEICCWTERVVTGSLGLVWWSSTCVEGVAVPDARPPASLRAPMKNKSRHSLSLVLCSVSLCSFAARRHGCYRTPSTGCVLCSPSSNSRSSCALQRRPSAAAAAEPRSRSRQKHVRIDVMLKSHNRLCLTGSGTSSHCQGAGYRAISGSATRSCSGIVIVASAGGVHGVLEDANNLSRINNPASIRSSTSLRPHQSIPPMRATTTPPSTRNSPRSDGKAPQVHV